VLKKVIEEEGISCVACGGLSGEFPVLYSLFRTVREIAPDVTILCGGGIITAEPEVAMRALEYADIGMFGEGDFTFPALLQCLESSGDLHKLKGIIFREGDQWVQMEPADEVMDLDALPFPDYHGFEYDIYLKNNFNGFSFQGEPLSPVSIIGSRSCPYSCTFCFHPTGNKYRIRSLDSVFCELDYLLQNFKINCVAMREELFSAEQDRIYEFAKTIKQYHIYWTIQLRVNLVNEDVIRMLAEADCFAVFLGIESMADEVLKSMNKKITSAQITQVLQWADKYKLQIRSGLIFGDKAETEDTAKRSLDWLKLHRNYNPVLRRPAIIADMLIPFPGSPIYNYAVANGIIADEVSYLKMGCPLVNLTSLSNDKYKNLLRHVQGLSGNEYHFWNGSSLEVLKP
jgi:radical SAM superfamily enzyme YgiQ (UPF0313 family)